jgi:hypothetical protein
MLCGSGEIRSLTLVDAQYLEAERFGHGYFPAGKFRDPVSAPARLRLSNLPRFSQ